MSTHMPALISYIFQFFYIIMYRLYDLPATEGLEGNSRLEPIIHIFFKYFVMGNPYNHSVLSSPVDIISTGVDILTCIRNFWKITYGTKKSCNYCTQQWQNYNWHLVLLRDVHFKYFRRGHNFFSASNFPVLCRFLI